VRVHRGHLRHKLNLTLANWVAWATHAWNSGSVLTLRFADEWGRASAGAPNTGRRKQGSKPLQIPLRRWEADSLMIPSLNLLVTSNTCWERKYHWVPTRIPATSDGLDRLLQIQVTLESSQNSNSPAQPTYQSASSYEENCCLERRGGRGAGAASGPSAGASGATGLAIWTRTHKIHHG
jgi:hypothetical protein